MGHRVCGYIMIRLKLESKGALGWVFWIIFLVEPLIGRIHRSDIVHGAINFVNNKLTFLKTKFFRLPHHISFVFILLSFFSATIPFWCILF